MIHTDGQYRKIDPTFGMVQGIHPEYTIVENKWVGTYNIHYQFA
jgi:hypothetical protein